MVSDVGCLWAYTGADLSHWLKRKQVDLEVYTHAIFLPSIQG